MVANQHMAAGEVTDLTQPAIKLYGSEQNPDAKGRNANPSVKLWKLTDLFEALLVSKSTGHRLLAAGKIGPKPIRLTASIIRFDVEECEAWLANRKQDGSLHDIKSWPTVWEATKRRR